MNIIQIPLKNITVVDNIRVNPTDKDIPSLMESIRQHGLKQAIGVQSIEDGKYRLTFGYRRYLAFRKLGWESIPAVVDSDKTEEEILIINAVENVQRKDISPCELGRVVELLIRKEKLNCREIGIRMNLPEDRIKTALSLFKRIPVEHHGSIEYMTGAKMKNTAIPATVAIKVAQVGLRYNLSKEKIGKLLQHARKEDYTARQLEIISLLMQDGLNVNNAAKRMNNYKIYAVNFVVKKREADSLVKQYGTNIINVMRMAMYGLIPPLECPTIVRKKLEGFKDTR